MSLLPTRVSIELRRYASRATPCGDKGYSVMEYFQRYYSRRCILTPKGRTAIALVLESLNLGSDDEVWITTTFETPNVSSHVTSTIFNRCRPSRVLTNKTRAILAIHEFGVPHPKTEELAEIARQRGIILIEDCAHTIDSRLNGKLVGTMGDFAIVSFPKIFPVEYGGLLVGGDVSYQPSAIQRKRIDEVQRALPPFLSYLAEYSERKRAHFAFLERRFAERHLKPLFALREGISPSFHFPLATPRWEEALEAAEQAGIEAALWHGTNVVVLPQHQFLTEMELEYVARVVSSVR